METLDPVVMDGRRTASVPAARFHRVQAPVSEDDLGFAPGERRRLARELYGAERRRRVRACVSHEVQP